MLPAWSFTTIARQSVAITLTLCYYTTIMQNIQDSNEEPPILTLEDVAAYLQVHASTIYRLLKRKQLPGFKLGRDWRFNRESIDRWRADAERGL